MAVRRTIAHLELVPGFAVRRLAFAAFALVAACASGRRGPAVPERIVVIDNRGFADMNIYVYDGARRQRLGTAPGISVTRLKLPSSMSSGIRILRFLCDPIGGSRSAVSQEITVGPDDDISLIIPPG